MSSSKLAIEAMAQASIILYAVVKPHNAKKNPIYYLGKVDPIFRKPVIPGDKLILEIIKEKLLDNIAMVKAIAKVNDVIVASATITFGIKLPQ